MHTIDSHNNSMAEEFSKWKPFSHHAITAYTHMAAEPAQCTLPIVHSVRDFSKKY